MPLANLRKLKAVSMPAHAMLAPAGVVGEVVVFKRDEPSLYEIVTVLAVTRDGHYSIARGNLTETVHGDCLIRPSPSALTLLQALYDQQQHVQDLLYHINEHVRRGHSMRMSMLKLQRKTAARNNALMSDMKRAIRMPIDKSDARHQLIQNILALDEEIQDIREMIPHEVKDVREYINIAETVLEDMRTRLHML